MFFIVQLYQHPHSRWGFDTTRLAKFSILFYATDTFTSVVKNFVFSLNRDEAFTAFTLTI